MNLFKNKVVTIALEQKPQPADVPTTEVVSTNPEEIVKIITESAVMTIGAIGAVIAGHRILSTACDIAVIVAKAKLK